jgi:hypothetical protein
MTPKEVQDALRALSDEIGPHAYVNAYIAGEDRGDPIYLAVYPNGITKSDLYFAAQGDDWVTVIAAARAQWAEHKDEHRKQAVTKMALEIIRITHAFGSCTEAQLRGDVFTAADIAAYGADAVSEANKMADNGPFSIAKAPAANMPEGGLDDDRVLQ